MKKKDLKMSGRKLTLHDIIVKLYETCVHSCGPNPKNVLIEYNHNGFDHTVEVYLEREETSEEKAKRLFKEDTEFRNKILELVKEHELQRP